MEGATHVEGGDAADADLLARAEPAARPSGVPAITT